MASPGESEKPDLRPPLLISNIVLTLAGALFVLTRLWVRLVRTKAHAWDDYFIIGALISSFVSMSLTIAMVQRGYGQTIGLLAPDDVVTAMKFSNFAVLNNGFSMAFLKISIGLSLLRLQLGRGMFWILWGSIVLSVVCNATVLVTTLFGCRPLAAVWDLRLVPAASCLPRTVNVTNSYIQTGGNIVTDLFYTFGPLYYLSKVKVSLYNRWALRGVFLIGLLATACAIAKCFELPKLSRTRDPTFDGVGITIWVRAELNAGLIAASIPPLKAVFENVLHNVFGVQSGLSTSDTGGRVSAHPASRRRTRITLADDEIAMYDPTEHTKSHSKVPHDHAREITDGESMYEEERHTSTSTRYGQG